MSKTRAQTRPVRTVFIGSGGFAVPTLRALARDPAVELVGIVTAPPRPAGRKLAPVATPIAKMAEEMEVAHVLTPTRLREQAAVSHILALEPGLLVLADYGQIVPSAVLDLPPSGILNVHPSLLPRHRGASPIPATILAGDRETGVTLMRMDAGLDTGPIVAASRWPLSGDETAPELEARAAAAGAQLVATTLGPWLRGEIAAHAQPAEGVTLTRPLRREDGRLDPTRSAVELERQVRAFQPWPGTFVDTDAGRLKVLRAAVATRGSGASEPATFGPGPGLRLHAADGDLVLLEVQPAGGRPMTGEELVLGRPTLPGSRVVRAREAT